MLSVDTSRHSWVGYPVPFPYRHQSYSQRLGLLLLFVHCLNTDFFAFQVFLMVGGGDPM